MALGLKFKAKRKDDGKWIFSESIQEISILSGKLISLYDVDEGWVVVREETLSVYSGKNDVNGVELYSNDKIAENNIIEYDFKEGFSINGDRPLRMFNHVVYHGNIFDDEEKVEHRG